MLMAASCERGRTEHGDLSSSSTQVTDSPCGMSEAGDCVMKLVDDHGVVRTTLADCGINKIAVFVSTTGLL